LLHRHSQHLGRNQLVTLLLLLLLLLVTLPSPTAAAAAATAAHTLRMPPLLLPLLPLLLPLLLLLLLGTAVTTISSSLGAIIAIVHVLSCLLRRHTTRRNPHITPAKPLPFAPSKASYCRGTYLASAQPSYRGGRAS
jgi:hypothetical protein